MKGIKHNGTKNIRTERLLLRKIKVSDYIDFHNNITHVSSVGDYFLIPYFDSISDTLNFVEGICSRYADDFYFYGIVNRVSKEMMGIISIYKKEDDMYSCEIGYALGPNYYNKGYASEALSALINYIFNEVGYNRIVCSYFIPNTASKRVMEKCGMHYEGIRKQEMYYHDAFHDLGYYYLLKEDYEKELNK